MNRQLFRVILNRARGMRMAVQESAASGRGRGRAGAGVTRARSFALKPLAATLALLLAAPAGLAQILPDRAAPGQQRPTVLPSANGTPTVNIQTPSAAGVSRNRYQQFDMDAIGAILNNSRTPVQSRIGGWVKGNEWLARGSARVIVNEVQSEARSRLMGPLEVAGQRADVVIANPSGLVIDGLSFINAAGVTLTTGRPLYGAGGSLKGFSVQNGLIHAQGQGLDASAADYARVLARAVSLNAGIWARDLRVVTGVNEMTVDGTPAAGTGDLAQKPQFALDVAQLGGMYAGRIFVVGTEAGLGVRNAGTLSATQGALTLTVDGQLHNTGAMASNAASADLKIAAQGIDNGGTLSSQQDLQLGDGGAGTVNAGTLQARRELRMQAGHLRNQAAGVVVAQRLDIGAAAWTNAGSVHQTGAQALEISAATLSNTGTAAVLGTHLAPAPVAAPGVEQEDVKRMPDASPPAPSTGQGGSVIEAEPAAPLVLDTGRIAVAQHLDNTGSLLANGATDLSTSQALTNHATIGVRHFQGNGTLDNSRGTLRAQQWSGTQAALDNRGGTLHVERDLSLAAQRLDNTGGSIASAGALTARVQEMLINDDGTIGSAQALALHTGALGNARGTIATPQALQLNSTALDNTSGKMAGASVAIDTRQGALNNGAGSIIASAGDLIVNSGALHAGNGRLEAAQDLAIDTHGQKLSNAGLLQAGRHAGIRAAHIDNRGGTVLAGNTALASADLTLDSSGKVRNAGGSLVARSDIKLTAAELDNAQGEIGAGGTLTARIAGAATNTGGKMMANAAVVLQSGSLQNDQQAAIGSNGGPVGIATGALSNHRGKIIAKAAATITSRALDNSRGRIGAASVTLDTQGQALTNVDAELLASGGELQVQSGPLDNQRGRIAATQKAQLTVQSLGNAAGRITAAELGIQSREAVHNPTGSLLADQRLQLDAAALDNIGGTLKTTRAGSALIVTSHGGDIANRQSGSAAGIASAGTLQLTASAGTIVNANGGRIDAAGDIRLDAQRLANRQGSVNSGGALQLTSTADAGTGIDNSAGGSLQAIGDMKIHAAGAAILNHNGAMLANNDMQLQSRGLVDNTEGRIRAGHKLSVTDAEVAAKAPLGSATQTVLNQGGTLFAGNDLSIRNRALSGTGKLQTQGAMRLEFASDHVHQSELAVDGHLHMVSDGKLTNPGRLMGGSGVTVTAHDIDNNKNAQIGSAGVTAVHARHWLGNRGLIHGNDTRVDARILNNLGTGRIFGSHVSIAARTLHNRAEGATGATVASHQDLDIGAAEIYNHDGAALRSVDGDMRFGAGLDDKRKVTGITRVIDNRDALIDAGGSIHFTVDTVNNGNAGIELTRQVHQGGHAEEDLYQVDGRPPESGKKFRWVEKGVAIPFYETADAIPGTVPFGWSPRGLFKVVYPDKFLTTLPLAYEAIPITNNHDDSVSYKYRYEPNDSTRFSEYKVHKPDNYNTVEPLKQNFGAIALESGEFDWRKDSNRAGYEAALKVYRNSIDAAKKLNDVILEKIREFNRIEGFWTDFRAIKNVRKDIYRDQVRSSKPGEIFAGGDMKFSGVLKNTESTVRARGKINIDANNHSEKGVETTKITGKAINYYRTSSRKIKNLFIKKSEDKMSDPVDFESSYAKTVDLGTAVFQQNYTGEMTHRYAIPKVEGGGRAPDGGAEVTRVAGPPEHIPPMAPQQAAPASTVPLTAAPPPAASRALEVRTSALPQYLPRSSLYVVNAASPNKPLVETDPAFTNYKRWSSSDDMLHALNLDPALLQKRLGDGFYEQQVMQQQVAQLTGRRFLGEHFNNDAQYSALLQNGITFAKAFGLRPGIALSAEQVAHMTSDLVWLVKEEVKLPDASVQTVLVPRLYVVARVGDLETTGALISADRVVSRSKNDMHNSGTIAGRRAVVIDARNIHNTGGRIRGESVGLEAQRDLNVVGGTVSAALSLLAKAGHDINVKTTTRSSRGGTEANGHANTSVDRVASLVLGPEDAVDGTVSRAQPSLVVDAAGNVEFQGARLDNAVEGASTAIKAGGDIVLSTVNTSGEQRIGWDVKNHLSFGHTQEVGTQIDTRGSTKFDAGRNFDARAAHVETTKALEIKAAKNVNIAAGQATQTVDSASFVRSRDLLGSSTSRRIDQLHATYSLGSIFGGDTLSITSGQDLAVQGSQLISDHGTKIKAARDVSILADTEETSRRGFSETTRSGLFGAGGLGVTMGRKQQGTDQTDTITRSAASTVGSIHGDVQIDAGGRYRQVGSDLLAPEGELGVDARKIDITEARESADSAQQIRARQSGLSIGIASPAISALQTARETGQAAGNTDSTRMRALGAASMGFAGYEAWSAIEQGQGSTIGGKQNQILTGKRNLDGTPETRDATDADRIGGLNFTLNLGRSSSSAHAMQSSRTARGSTLQAGKGIKLKAKGAGADSNITLQGVDADANRIVLDAENKINLLAARNTAEQHSTQRSRSTSAGLSVGSDGLLLSASAGDARGKADGSDVTWSNTHLRGREQVVIRSGGDTRLQGAVVEAEQITGKVGGHLQIESLQDTSTYHSQQKSRGASMAAGYGQLGGSLQFGKNQIGSDYANVTEQSGLKAGSGGFAIEVAKDTVLDGGVISSTQQAIDDKKNAFKTGGELKTSDIQNFARHDAQGFSASIGTTPSTKGLTPAGSMGVGQQGSHTTSTTRAGISGMAANQDVRTGDAESGVANRFDARKVQGEIDSRVDITKEAGRQAGKWVGELANAKQRELLQRAAGSEGAEKDRLLQEAKDWSEGGVKRAGMHALGGGLTAGLGGALGAGASSLASPVLIEEIAKSNFSVDTKLALIQAASAGVGAAVGGMEGGAAGFNEASNNTLFNLGKALEIGARVFEKLSAAQVAVMQSCIASPSCKTFVEAALPAGAMAWFVSQNTPDAPAPSLADQIPGYGGGNQPDFGPDHTGNNNVENPVAGGTSTEFPAEKSPGLLHTGGNQIEEEMGNRGVIATPLPEPQFDLLILAIPAEAKKAIFPELQEVMGSMPAVERQRKSSNSIRRYENGKSEEMEKIFDRLSLTDIHEIETKHGWVKRGDLPDGTRVIIRSKSSDGAPTLQVIDMSHPEKRTVLEIRFGKGEK